MDKDRIVYFSELGFGWVVDDSTVNEVCPNNVRDELIGEALCEIIEDKKRIIL